ncbi:MAG: inorganic pyrophosphatase Ppa [Desulfobacteraceae bacterium]|nr:inorganic pyrophosphatase Ppa [Desulfobacteraceae bacterium]
MNMSLLIKETEKFEITAYKPPKNIGKIQKTHVSFSGSPRKHPFDPYRVILVVDPYSSNTFYYEFKADDISFVEELPHMVNLDEEVITIVRIWVRKRCLAVRCTPFWVDDTTK